MLQSTGLQRVGQTERLNNYNEDSIIHKRRGVWIRVMDKEKAVDEDKVKNINHQTLTTFQGENQNVNDNA